MKKQLLALVILSILVTACTEEATHAPSSQPSPVRVQLLKPRAMITLEKGLKNRDPKIRTNAIEAAVESRQKDMLPLITNLTTDSIVPVRFAATVALGDMNCHSCKNLIQRLLNDTDINVRIAAAYSLAKLNQPDYLSLLQAAAKNSNQTVRANAALLLGKLGDNKNIDLLYDILQATDSIDKVRMQAIESIARLGDERMYRSKLWAMQISKFADDRVIGIRGMGALNTVESRDAIAVMLQDDVLEVRLAAAEQLGRLGDYRGKNVVLSYFRTSPDLNKPGMASGMAVLAIGHLKNKQINAFLPNALDSKDPYIQLLAAQSVLVQLL